MLVAKQRLVLTMHLDDWLASIERVDAITFIPVSNRIALRSNQLPQPIHKDPADRMIIATAKEIGCPLVTADERIRDYQFVETIW